MPDSESGWSICIIEFQYEQILSNFIFDPYGVVSSFTKTALCEFFGTTEKNQNYDHAQMCIRRRSEVVSLLLEEKLV